MPTTYLIFAVCQDGRYLCGSNSWCDRLSRAWHFDSEQGAAAYASAYGGYVIAFERRRTA